MVKGTFAVTFVEMGDRGAMTGEIIAREIAEVNWFDTAFCPPAKWAWNDKVQFPMKPNNFTFENCVMPYSVDAEFANTSHDEGSAEMETKTGSWEPAKELPVRRLTKLRY